jgi:hypothetical protein
VSWATFRDDLSGIDGEAACRRHQRGSESFFDLADARRKSSVIASEEKQSSSGRDKGLGCFGAAAPRNDDN